VRKAAPSEKQKIAKAIANSYSEELSILTKDQAAAAKVFERGIHTERFWVCTKNDEIIKHSKQYSEFVLDVMDNNIPAIKSDEKLGFIEFKREPFRGGKSKGIKYKVYMKLTV
jgi:hypothetical protein